jgi:hypothetical protein
MTIAGGADCEPRFVIEEAAVERVREWEVEAPGGED